MKRWLWFVLVLVLSMTLLFTACDSDDDDDPVSTPPVHGELDGTWTFVLTAPDSSGGEDSVVEEVYLYEQEGAITGYSETFSLLGSRIDNDVTIDVLRPIEDVMELESSMTLVVDDDNTMLGAGATIIPKVQPFLLNDSTLHEKFVSTHEDWDGGAGGSYLYAVNATRITSAPAMSIAQKQAEEHMLASINWCDVIWSIDSFLIATLTDNIVRPFGNCGFQHDGGGYYLAGRVGPGSTAPIWTQTVYYPVEWAWCDARTYGFTMTIGGPWSGYEMLAWLHENWTQNAVDEYGMTLEVVYDLMTDFYNAHGGFAICAGYSTRTRNTSLYLMSVQSHNRQVFESHPLTNSFMDAVDVNRPGGLWVFTGQQVHDTWGLQRDATGICGTPLLFTYLIGTNQVTFD